MFELISFVVSTFIALAGVYYAYLQYEHAISENKQAKLEKDEVKDESKIVNRSNNSIKSENIVEKTIITNKYQGNIISVTKLLSEIRDLSHDDYKIKGFNLSLNNYDIDFKIDDISAVVSVFQSETNKIKILKLILNKYKFDATISDMYDMMSNFGSETYRMEILKLTLNKYKFDVTISDMYDMMSNFGSETYRMEILKLTLNKYKFDVTISDMYDMMSNFGSETYKMGILKIVLSKQKYEINLRFKDVHTMMSNFQSEIYRLSVLQDVSDKMCEPLTEKDNRKIMGYFSSDSYKLKAKYILMYMT